MKKINLLLSIAVFGLLLATPVMAVSSDEVLGAVEKVSPDVEKVAQKLWDLSGDH